jgi:hypothetical protein
MWILFVGSILQWRGFGTNLNNFNLRVQKHKFEYKFESRNTSRRKKKKFLFTLISITNCHILLPHFAYCSLMNIFTPHSFSISLDKNEFSNMNGIKAIKMGNICRD